MSPHQVESIRNPDQCRDIAFSMLRHRGNVTTLQSQCRDIEVGHLKFFYQCCDIDTQCHDIALRASHLFKDRRIL